MTRIERSGSSSIEQPKTSLTQKAVNAFKRAVGKGKGKGEGEPSSTVFWKDEWSKLKAPDAHALMARMANNNDPKKPEAASEQPNPSQWERAKRNPDTKQDVTVGAHRHKTGPNKPTRPAPEAPGAKPAQKKEVGKLSQERKAFMAELKGPNLGGFNPEIPAKAHKAQNQAERDLDAQQAKAAGAREELANRAAQNYKSKK